MDQINSRIDTNTLKNYEEKGFCKGIEEGKILGKLEGIEERNLEIAKELILEEMPIEKISKITGLDEAIVLEIRQNLNETILI